MAVGSTRLMSMPDVEMALRAVRPFAGSPSGQLWLQAPDSWPQPSCWPSGRKEPRRFAACTACGIVRKPTVELSGKRDPCLLWAGFLHGRCRWKALFVPVAIAIAANLARPAIALC